MDYEEKGLAWIVLLGSPDIPHANMRRLYLLSFAPQNTHGRGLLQYCGADKVCGACSEILTAHSQLIV